jgi:hypothetical protein
MTVQFKRLLTVHVSHGYYGGRCDAADFIVPADTEAVMRGGRLIAKRVDGSLCLFYEASEGGGPLAPLKGQALRFGLKPVNASFANVTDLAFAPGALVSLQGNADRPDVLGPPDTAVLTGRVLRHAVSRDARPVTVTVRAADGATLGSETAAGAETPVIVSFDLGGADAGPLAIREQYADGTSAETRGYLDAELQAVGVVGVVHLVVDPAFYEAPPEFTVEYGARKEVLRYYVVATNYKDKDFDDLVVSDEGFEEEKRDRVTFARVPSGNFGVEEQPVAALGGSDASSVVLFKSQGLVSRRQGGRKNIRLKRNDDVLIDNLPQPQPERASADLVVHLSKS